jgi:H+/Cl- antiporter ClcA
MFPSSGSDKCDKCIKWFPEGEKLLVLGAQMGLLFGVLMRVLFPALNLQLEGFAVVGMAALFTGIVRAPLTGIVLVT